MHAILEARALTKSFGAHIALQNVSFSVGKGEVVGLLGLNGAGKTTTLRLLSGLLHPTSGEVFIGGRPMLTESEAARGLLGFLPETPPLYGEMSVLGYLQFAARLRGATHDVPTLIEAALSATDLQSVADSPIAALSHGTQRRVGIAQAIVHRPAVVLLDEPTHGLDPIQVIQMRKLILSLKGRHTVLVSSHLLTEISALCDRLIVLDEGRLLAQGTEAELAEIPASEFRLVLEAKTSTEAMAQALSQMPAVKLLQLEAISASVASALVVLEKDLRADLIRHLVAQNMDLIAVERQKPALENIFMQLMGRAKHSAMAPHASPP